jgi:hypothetical protein
VSWTDFLIGKISKIAISIHIFTRYGHGKFSKIAITITTLKTMKESEFGACLNCPVHYIV